MFIDRREFDENSANATSSTQTHEIHPRSLLKGESSNTSPENGKAKYYSFGQRGRYALISDIYCKVFDKKREKNVEKFYTYVSLLFIYNMVTIRLCEGLYKNVHQFFV